MAPLQSQTPNPIRYTLKKDDRAQVRKNDGRTCYIDNHCGVSQFDLIGYGLILASGSDYIQQENDRIGKIRTKAVATFAEIWHDNPDTLPWLKSATSDGDEDVRWAAVKAIASGWKDDPDTLPWLKRATSDADSTVRHIALTAIAFGWKDDPETLPWLKRATSDENSDVRRAALEEISRGWKDDPDTLPLLKIATSDENWDVRRAAVEAIVFRWINEPGIFELLSQIALTDPFVREYDYQDNPRKTALIAILNNYADCPADTLRERPEVVEILRDRSINDPDEPLRQFAQKKLAEWERQSSV